MDLTTEIIIALIGAIIAVLTYFAGVKRTSNAEIEKRAYFEGEINAKLQQLLDTVKELKVALSTNTDKLYDEISKQIEEHERRYHANE